MSTRNNQDKLSLGLPETHDSDLSSTLEESNFSFAAPTDFVELPSKGRYYPEEHPLYNKEVVEIHYMTAKDEDILTSESLLKKGLALDRFVRNILVDKSIDVQSLLLGDKSAILIAARVTGYGVDYTVEHPCLSCGFRNEVVYNLNEIKVVKYAENIKEVNAELTNRGTFLIELPTTKAMVELKLMTGKEEVQLQNLKSRRKRLKLDEANLTDNLKTIIASVNNDDHANVINEFVQKLPSIDAKHIRSTYQELVPTVELKTLFECDDCGYTKEVNVPLTVQFFWPE